MKKKIASLALVLALCLSLLPVTAFAEEEEKALTPKDRTITTVDELMEFVQAVNEGTYTNQTEAVVSLEADLDLTGRDWVSMGKDDNYFSGKFYGNGHTISNLDFSSLYGKDEYTGEGFFGEIYDAQVSGLTIQGTINVDSARNYTYFGVLAGYSGGCTFSNCVSEVSFKNNGNLVYGTFGLIGQAIDTTVEYCRNVADITITGDMGSLYVGGIVGYAQGTTVRYCANTADMVLAVPQGGGIAGQLGSGCQVTNCYVTGKLTGFGSASLGGIAGIVGANTGIQHCYFSGSIDSSQVKTTKVGGIAGDSSTSAVCTNNYFAEAENLKGCGRGIENDTIVASAKSADNMKTLEFYNKLTEGGGDYIYVAESTPVLPAPKYTVSFDITPTDNLTDVTVKIGKETLDFDSKEIALAAGTYKVTVNDIELKQEITITADRATHTQTLDLTADYSKVDAALEKVPADLTGYTDASVAALKEAIAAVDRTKNVTQQDEVDAMATAIEKAINGLTKKSSGSSSSGSGNTTTKTETTTNPDGSTTKTETKKDGSVTETTTGTDGSVTKTETKTDTKSDGSKTETKTETKTDADGNKTTSKTETTTDKSGTVTESKTETKTDADGTKTEVKSETKKDQNGVTTGTETVKETLPNGSTGTTMTTTDANGTKTEAVTTISSKAVDEAKKNDEAVTVPVDVKATEDSQTAPTVKVELPKNSGETKVEIPVSNVTPGTVVAVVKPDGTEEIVKDCIPTENGIQLAVEDNVTLKVFDNAKDFTDTKGHWAEPYIDFASARELLNGISEDTFAPEQPTTRAMMWTVLARQDDTDLSGGTTWYDKAQAWAKDSGVSDGTAPQANVTRAQMVTMLWRAAGSPAPQTMSSFADVSADAYYAAAVAWAAEQGITNGVSATQFQPNGACTRAQIAAFLYRASLEN